MQQQSSGEVAALMQRIRDEHEAAVQCLAGIAQGTAQHNFINAHMERMEAMRTKLAEHVGDNEAMTVICQVMLSE